MRRLFAFLPWVRDSKPTGLDMGDGMILPPEDVLEGHSARLLQNRRLQQNRTIVPVQVNDAVSSAIAVLAPDLSPLADLAEEVAYAVPAVQPEPTFRQNLYDALERTHRQHMIEEKLGTRPGTVSHSMTRWIIASITVSAVVASVTAVLVTWAWQKSRK